MGDAGAQAELGVHIVGIAAVQLRRHADADLLQVLFAGRPHIRQVGQAQQMRAVHFGGMHR